MVGKTETSSAKESKEKEISKGNEKEKIAEINKCIWCIFIVASMFLILNGIEGFATFINTLYAGLVWGEYSFLDVYKYIHPHLLVVASYAIMTMAVVLCIGNIGVRAWFKWKQERCGMEGFEKDAFNEKMYDYLTAPNNGKCIVVTAAWGQGKSYLIRKFMEEFTRYRWNHVYTVSCFGIENREQLKELLENEMYCEDVSTDKIIFALLEHIPVIGTIIALLREQKYSMKKISKKDIIILEDVERIVPPGEDQDVKEKLNIIAGFVHELVDRYQNKVIMVCNVDELNPQAYQECIYKKLACEEVTISSSHIVIPFMEDAFIGKNISVMEVEKMRKLLLGDDSKKGISDTILTILNDVKIENKRLMQKVFSNQADFCKYSKNENKDITIDFLYSYLLWEIAKEKADENDSDADKVLGYLSTLQEVCTFPELYLKIMEEKKELELSGKEWWHGLLLFPITQYWVGISELETYAKRTAGIYSGRKLNLIKMPENIEKRMQAKCWEILWNVTNGEKDETLIPRLENEIKEEECWLEDIEAYCKVKDLPTHEQQQLYINPFLLKGYLVEFYRRKYMSIGSDKIRNFIIEEYELNDKEFNNDAYRYMQVHYPSHCSEVTMEMSGKKQELLRKEAAEELGSEDNQMEPFINAG